MTGCRWWRAAVVGGCKSNALSRGDLVTWPISVPPFYQCYPKSYPPPLEPASTASCCTFCSLVPVVFSSSNSCWILPSRVCRFRVVLVQIRTFLDRACLFPAPFLSSAFYRCAIREKTTENVASSNHARLLFRRSIFGISSGIDLLSHRFH